MWTNGHQRTLYMASLFQKIYKKAQITNPIVVSSPLSGTKRVCADILNIDAIVLIYPREYLQFYLGSRRLVPMTSLHISCLCIIQPTKWWQLSLNPWLWNFPGVHKMCTITLGSIITHYYWSMTCEVLLCTHTLMSQYDMINETQIGELWKLKIIFNNWKHYLK